MNQDAVRRFGGAEGAGRLVEADEKLDEAESGKLPDPDGIVAEPTAG